MAAIRGSYRVIAGSSCRCLLTGHGVACPDLALPDGGLVAAKLPRDLGGGETRQLTTTAMTSAVAGSSQYQRPAPRMFATTPL